MGFAPCTAIARPAVKPCLQWRYSGSRRARITWGERAERCGAVTFIQRFGSALNLNVHFHTLALDGAYLDAPGHSQAPRFLPLPPPEPEEVSRVLAGAAKRIQRVIEARDVGDEDAPAGDEPLLALLAMASLRTRIATGAHRDEPWRHWVDDGTDKIQRALRAT